MNLPPNKTKIVATIGPASDAPEMLERLMFSYGVRAIRTNEELENWRDFIGTWFHDHQVPARLAILLAGPSTRNPDANHRVEFLRFANPGCDPVPT